MGAKTFLALVSMAAPGLATFLHVDIGCILVGGTHEVCASDGPYSINGGEAQILCKLDANPTLVMASWPQYYHEVWWTQEDCLVDAENIKITCASWNA